MSRIVIAPDSFKGTVSAADAAAAIGRGWAGARPGDELVARPMADGGERTIDAVAAAVPEARRVPVEVRGPSGEAVRAEWLLLPAAPGSDAGPSALVELANTSGLTLLDRPAPFDADTFGFGQAIAAALDAGAQRLLLAIGGSGSTDGGLGVLAALGAEFLDADGRPAAPGNRGLAGLAAVRFDGLRALPPGGATVLSDVTNPLLGPLGAAEVFGAQKGADAAGRRALEAGLARFADVVGRALGTAAPDVAAPDVAALGAGAAGGTGYGLLAWGATMTSGAAAVARTIGLTEAVDGAELVVTGEGRFDGQSAAGKVPSEVARIADEAGVPRALVAGAVTAEPTGFRAAVALAELGGIEAAMAEPERWLERAGAELARGFG